MIHSQREMHEAVLCPLAGCCVGGLAPSVLVGVLGPCRIGVTLAVNGASWPECWCHGLDYNLSPAPPASSQ